MVVRSYNTMGDIQKRVRELVELDHTREQVRREIQAELVEYFSHEGKEFLDNSPNKGMKPEVFVRSLMMDVSNMLSREFLKRGKA